MGERRLARLDGEFDVRDAAYEERLGEDREAAERIGITGIPVFIVNGRWIIEGAVPVEMLREEAKKVFAGQS